jgi:hypothetical protein
MARTWRYAIALTLVVTAVLVASGLEHELRVHAPPSAVVVWDAHAFTSVAAIKKWLRARDIGYGRWARDHPAAVAALAQRRASEQYTPPPAQIAVKRRHFSLFSGLWLLTCLAFGAALVPRAR